MTIDELLRQRRVYRQDSAPADVRATLDRAEQDLKSAEHISRTEASTLIDQARDFIAWARQATRT